MRLTSSLAGFVKLLILFHVHIACSVPPYGAAYLKATDTHQDKVWLHIDFCGVNYAFSRFLRLQFRVGLGVTEDEGKQVLVEECRVTHGEA